MPLTPYAPNPVVCGFNEIKMEFGRDRQISLGNMNQASFVLADGSPHGKKRKAAAAVNYHTMTNNAIFPTDEVPDVIHYTTKKHATDNKTVFAPTLRGKNPSNLDKYNEASVYQNAEPNIKKGDKSLSPGSNKNFNDLSHQPTSYQATFAGNTPDYQVKKTVGKRLLAAPYTLHRNKDDKFLGVGMVVLNPKGPEKK